MPKSLLRFVKRCAEFIPQENIDDPKPDKYNVLYVGMAHAGRRGGIRGKLASHRRKKSGLWTDFCVFEVWDDIHNDEVAELEGLFRRFYRLNGQANSPNVQRGVGTGRWRTASQFRAYRGPRNGESWFESTKGSQFLGPQGMLLSDFGCPY